MRLRTNEEGKYKNYAMSPDLRFDIVTIVGSNLERPLQPWLFSLWCGKFADREEYMTLSIVDPAVLKPLVIAGWKQYLYKDKGLAVKEPTAGPSFDGVTEGSIQTIFDYDHVSVTKTEIVNVTETCDNRNGITEGRGGQFTHTYTKEQSISHASTSAFSYGISESIDLSGKVCGIGADSDTTFDFNYSTSTSNSETKSEKTSDEITINWTLEPPAGKRYQVCLVLKAHTVNVPFTCSVVLTGRPSITFDGKVWTSEIGNAIYFFQNDLVKVCNANNYGAIVHGITGLVSGSQSMDLSVVTIDTTESTPVENGMTLPDNVLVVEAKSLA